MKKNLNNHDDCEFFFKLQALLCSSCHLDLIGRCNAASDTCSSTILWSFLSHISCMHEELFVKCLFSVADLTSDWKCVWKNKVILSSSQPCGGYFGDCWAMQSTCASIWIYGLTPQEGLIGAGCRDHEEKVPFDIYTHYSPWLLQVFHLSHTTYTTEI